MVEIWVENNAESPKALVRKYRHFFSPLQLPSPCSERLHEEGLFKAFCFWSQTGSRYLVSRSTLLIASVVSRSSAVDVWPYSRGISCSSPSRPLWSFQYRSRRSRRIHFLGFYLNSKCSFHHGWYGARQRTKLPYSSYPNPHLSPQFPSERKDRFFFWNPFMLVKTSSRHNIKILRGICAICDIDRTSKDYTILLGP